MIVARAFAGFSTTPPKLPEWRSIGPPTTSTCAYMIPRRLAVIDGMLPSKNPLSLMIATSEVSRSRFASIQRSRWTDDDSSSPSKT